MLHSSEGHSFYEYRTNGTGSAGGWRAHEMMCQQYSCTGGKYYVVLKPQPRIVVHAMNMQHCAREEFPATVGPAFAPHARSRQHACVRLLARHPWPCFSVCG